LAPLGAGLLALERGVLYGSGRHGWVASTLISEPLVRIGVGLGLTVAIGVVGAAVGVVAGGYVALAVAVGARRKAHLRGDGVAGDRPARREDLRSAGTVLAFLLLALLQNQDLLLSGRLLDGVEAGHFAVLSTLGGAAAFATVTVPLVLLGRAGRDPRGSLGVAIAVAAAIGGAIVIGATLLPELVVLTFGERYAAVSELAALYLGAMAFFGVGRVLVAHRCAVGHTRSSIALLSLVALGHLVLLLVIGTDPAGIARSTLAATVALTAVFGAAVVVRLPESRGLAAHRVSSEDARRAFLFVGGVALLALTLRLLVARGIWVDEAITVHQAQLPFADMLDSVRNGDVHPPLHLIILWPVIRVFGTGELAVRLPSIVFGVALVGMLYVAGRDLFDRATGRLAALLGAVAPLLVWYSQEARMYALFMFLSVVAVWAQVMALRHGRLRFWALYGIVAAALIWTHYFAALPIAVQQIAFGIEAVRRFRRRREPDSRFKELAVGWATAVLITVLALAPLAPIVSDQLAAYGQRSTQVPSQVGTAAAPSTERPSIYAVLANVIWSVWGYHSDETMILLGALWPVGMLLALLMLGRGRSWNTSLLAALVVVPMVALFVIGLFKRDLFEVRYFAGAIPALVLLAARALRKLSPNRAFAAATAGALVLSMGAALADQQLNRSNPRIYDFEGALDEVSRRARPQDKVLFAPDFMNRVVDYYAPELEAAPLDVESIPGTGKANRIFLVGSFLDMEQHSGTVGAALAELEGKRRLAGEFERPQVKVWVFK
jgi:hypothetical protein